MLKYDKNSYNILKLSGNNCPSEDYYFKECLTWSDVTSGNFCIRYFPNGAVFSTVGNSIFSQEISLANICCALASNVVSEWLKIINPTLHANPGDVSKLPFYQVESSIRFSLAVSITRKDWDAYETSWGFTILPLLYSSSRQTTLKATYTKLLFSWEEMTQEMRHIEEENNCIFIEAYGLQDELTPDVPLKEITLTCNPHYRYGGDKTEEELEALLLADTMREFLSYAAGCMFGRYSLDKPGLILANQGDTLIEYLQQVPEPSFMPNQDNVIPVLDGDWFTDDITERFRQFLRVTFGEAYYEENLAFIEAALGKNIRKYFLKDFYNDHVRRYKKRPIYWLFSSPKGSFNALIYLHRYRPDTVSVVLQYLRDFRKKLAARLDYLQQVGISPSTSQSEKTRAQKEIDTIKKQLLELDDYERDTLYPLATAQIALDLDDGVKVNYLKLGPALKKIVGLDAKGED
ncbi:BREX-1 system adenine-specific DNA-methyltransferase PglX [Acidithiobacillus ferrooxidans]|uniref:BREX-1 system adenine-specific DNA-methyltransferase PglX n=2 Tax=Acidithiobacillus ferrooxidans TaxID=920 RepID=UPI000F932D32|nr:BREX-1 system adenine-specific DNA-methyltransferase PglX [Acidithiobacillus ferrooxidans]MBU2819176.1 BREX-1 system adenine-specific DNA-methyltransferase PglX [Acidithiobacillus ferrooxidans]MCR1342444.1 BREX-1 system adenine-specific DNA-methyltransferase PglX [Acidithiobacillus ferrooxidans]QLK41609.1 BREX-1 system adenine-specific DNA-methyltransferase PglX [Acidithiobacillus ferrooxidans]QZT54199.1 BREX-1 system adenine-specific DNA-methyltransferase PglX [Acidithiobacillus ferrooxidan